MECIEESTGVCSYAIATVYLKDMDYNNKRCELCIFTSSDVEWNREGQAIAIEMLTEKAFKEYGMHKVYSYVFCKFPEEVELLQKAGFSIEATLKEEALNEIQKVNLVNRKVIEAAAANEVNIPFFEDKKKSK